jgi:hypothetical protein
MARAAIHLAEGFAVIFLGIRLAQSLISWQCYCGFDPTFIHPGDEILHLLLPWGITPWATLGSAVFGGILNALLARYHFDVLKFAAVWACSAQPITLIGVTYHQYEDRYDVAYLSWIILICGAYTVIGWHFGLYLAAMLTVSRKMKLSLHRLGRTIYSEIMPAAYQLLRIAWSAAMRG